MQADRLQRRFISAAVGLPRSAEDDGVSYVRKRQRYAATMIEDNDGWWTLKWFLVLLLLYILVLILW